MGEREMRGKQEMRKRLAALSFSEKIKILEKLRDRSLAIGAAGLRRGAAKGPGNVKGSSKQGRSADVNSAGGGKTSASR